MLYNYLPISGIDRSRQAFLCVITKGNVQNMKPVQFCTGNVQNMKPVQICTGNVQNMKPVQNTGNVQIETGAILHRKCTKYETCAILIRFHILYISFDRTPLSAIIRKNKVTTESVNTVKPR